MLYFAIIFGVLRVWSMSILKVIGISFLSCCALIENSVLEAKNAEDVGVVCELACVNNTPITNLDIIKRKNLLNILSQNSANIGNDKFLENAILESIIQEKVKFEYAKRIFNQAGQILDISPKEIATELSEMSASYGLTPKEFVKFLEEKKIDLSVLKDHIKNDIAWMMYLNGKYGSLVDLSNREVANYRDKLKKDYKERAYNVERLFFPYRSFDSNKVKTEKFVHKLIELLKSGISFDILARVFSSLSSSTGNGAYGFITVGQLPFKAENDQLKKMKRGETAIVRMNNGVSLIRVSNIRAALHESQEIVTFKYVVDQSHIKNTQSLEANYVRFSNLSQKYNHNANDLIRNAKKLGYFVSDDNEVAIMDLPEEIRKIVASLKIGTFSEPVVTPDGVLSICLLKKEIFKISIPTIEECKNKLYEDKINNMSETEYRNAVKSVYVERKSNN